MASRFDSKRHLRELEMKRCVHWAICISYVTVAVICGAAGFTPVPLNCGMLQSSVVTNPDQRIEVSVPGFSVLPAQGENWCVKSLASQGLSFLKAPVSVAVFGQPLSPDELFPVGLRAARFTGLAVSFPDFGFNTGSPERWKVAVDEMINTHIFSQFVGGISSAERRYQLLESHSLVDRSFGASCIRFEAKVEERGMYQAPPGVVIILNLSNNLICAHPKPASPKSRLIWIGFLETYREGDQPAADTVRQEVEPFLQSLQFMRTR
jgi:hypothetical protein